MDTLTQLRTGKLAGTTRLDLRCGLTEFPREIFDLADSLEILDLSGNRLFSLPDDFGRLKKLRILFCSENEFEHLPDVLGDCPQLGMIGFKANHIESFEAAALPESLRWLILTGNRVRELPAALGRCTRLQKLMLSGNRLSQLPEEMAACTSLELMRLAANELRALPPWLLTLPRLSWLAFAGNPCSTTAHQRAPTTARIAWKSLQLKGKLGEGASGEIHRALWRRSDEGEEKQVAVKLFRGAMTSDGLPSSEMDAALAAGIHDHLIPVHGRLTDHHEGKEGLVMSLIDPAYVPLAGPPSLETCTRDVYPEPRQFSAQRALSLAHGIASVAQQLHARCIMHGDLYAHNVLWNPNGHCYFGDFGAATFYGSDDTKMARALQGIEVRAFGCLLGELLDRSEWTEDDLKMQNNLRNLEAQCAGTKVGERPSFDEITRELRRNAEQLGFDAPG
jgi:hypothetical protein